MTSYHQDYCYLHSPPPPPLAPPPSITPFFSQHRHHRHHLFYHRYHGRHHRVRLFCNFIFTFTIHAFSVPLLILSRG